MSKETQKKKKIPSSSPRTPSRISHAPDEPAEPPPRTNTLLSWNSKKGKTPTTASTRRNDEGADVSQSPAVTTVAGADGEGQPGAYAVSGRRNDPHASSSSTAADDASSNDNDETAAAASPSQDANIMIPLAAEVQPSPSQVPQVDPETLRAQHFQEFMEKAERVEATTQTDDEPKSNKKLILYRGIVLFLLIVGIAVAVVLSLLGNTNDSSSSSSLTGNGERQNNGLDDSEEEDTTSPPSAGTGPTSSPPIPTTESPSAQQDDDEPCVVIDEESCIMGLFACDGAVDICTAPNSCQGQAACRLTFELEVRQGSCLGE